MAILAPFQPHYGTNQVVTPGAASAAINIDPTDRSVRVVNSGAAKGYFRLYKSTDVVAPSATTADVCVPSGGAIVVTKAEGFDRLAHISATGTTFEVMTGEGWI